MQFYYQIHKYFGKCIIIVKTLDFKHWLYAWSINNFLLIPLLTISFSLLIRVENLNLKVDFFGCVVLITYVFELVNCPFKIWMFQVILWVIICNVNFFLCMFLVFWIFITWSMDLIIKFPILSLFLTFKLQIIFFSISCTLYFLHVIWKKMKKTSLCNYLISHAFK
jgi:hypothetical protein